MSNLSAVDQLRIALNMTLSPHLEPFREQMMAQCVAHVTHLNDALLQFTREDLENLPAPSLAWARAQFMHFDDLPFETWSALLLYSPQRPRKAKDSSEGEGNFAGWAKTHDSNRAPVANSVRHKNAGGWDNFLLLEKMFKNVPIKWADKNFALENTCDKAKSRVTDVLKYLSVDALSETERARVCALVLSLPPLLFPPQSMDQIWENTSFAWLGAITRYGQTIHHAFTSEWELRSVQLALKKLDREPENSLNLLRDVLPGFTTDPRDFTIRPPHTTKVFSHYNDVLNVLDAHLNWNQEDKLRFLPSEEQFIKIVRRRIVPNSNVKELVDDLFAYPMQRMPNPEHLVQEFVHRFQVFMFFSVFANTMNELADIAAVVNKIPPYILHASQSTPAQPIDLKTVEAIIAPSYARLGLKMGLQKILNSKKRKDERYIAVRTNIMQWLPPDLANSAQLLLHWADPQQYDKPEGLLTSLAVSKRGKDVDSTDVAELRSLFLKHNLLLEVGGMGGSSHQRKM